MFIQGVIFMIIVLAIELGLLRRIFTFTVQKASKGLLQDTSNIPTDSDVSDETERINSTPINDLLESESLILKVSCSWNFMIRLVSALSS